jgi:hypothetical protein
MLNIRELIILEYILLSIMDLSINVNLQEPVLLEYIMVFIMAKDMVIHITHSIMDHNTLEHTLETIPALNTLEDS